MLPLSGDLDRLQKFWLAGACHAVKDKKDKSSPDIGILNFTSAFILLAGGVLLGTMLLAFEHLYFKFGRKCLKKYDKSGCCALISLVCLHFTEAAATVLSELISWYCLSLTFIFEPRQANLCLRAFRHDKF